MPSKLELHSLVASLLLDALAAALAYTAAILRLLVVVRNANAGGSALWVRTVDAVLASNAGERTGEAASELAPLSAIVRQIIPQNLQTSSSVSGYIAAHVFNRDTLLEALSRRVSRSSGRKILFSNIF